MNYRRAVMSGNFRVPGGLLAIFMILNFERGSGISGSPLNPNEKSICKRYHRVTATRRVSYTETYTPDYDYSLHYRYSSIATRMNFRTEDLTKWQPIEMCCEGYEPHEQAEEATTCVPVCPSDCVNGTCLSPNVCTCDPGYRPEMNNLTGYSECAPICPSGCLGGSCTAPHTCSCDFGYLLAKDKGSCEATCTAVGGPRRGCVDNASCIAPNTCRCDNGYTPTANSSRLADHYFIDGDVKITDKPSEIADRTTFNASNIFCEALCEPECEKNSHCAAPNKCECNVGYRSPAVSDRETNNSRCIAVCEKSCFNGYCGSPNKCVCLEGYRPHRLLKEEFCEPICSEGCVNAECRRPSHCECLDGYEKLILRSEGRERASDNVCVPVCPGECANGFCTSPGQCHCNAGFVLDFPRPDETDVTDPSTSGSRLDRSTRQSCRPLCEPECPRGSLCIAPDRCRYENERERGFKDLARMQTRIVDSGEDCGNDGVFYKENGTCGCEYRLDERGCTEPVHCAVIFADEAEDDIKLINLQSIVFPDETSGPRNGPFDRGAPRCTDTCRVSILSKKSLDAIDRRTDHCYLLEPYNATVGLLNTTLGPLLPTSAEENETLICLVSAETMCGTLESKMVNGVIRGVVGGIVGTILLLALIVGLLLMFLTRRRIRKIEVCGANSGSNGNMMEHSEIMEQSDTVE